MEQDKKRLCVIVSNIVIDSYLRCQQRGEHQAGLLLILNDIRVVVHPEDARCGGQRESSDILEKFLVFVDFGYVINTTLVELVFLHLEDLHAIVSVEDRVQRSPVPFVRHPTAIITLAYRIGRGDRSQLFRVENMERKIIFDKLIFSK